MMKHRYFFTFAFALFACAFAIMGYGLETITEPEWVTPIFIVPNFPMIYVYIFLCGFWDSVGMLEVSTCSTYKALIYLFILIIQTGLYALVGFGIDFLRRKRKKG
jgi:hypothetical protein